MGMGCPLTDIQGNPNNMMFGMYPDKVFPEEVDNIKEFMSDTFSTNVNGYPMNMNQGMNDMSTQGSSMEEIEKEISGQINVQPMPIYEDRKTTTVSLNQNEVNQINNIAQNSNQINSSNTNNRVNPYQQQAQMLNSQQNLNPATPSTDNPKRLLRRMR